jgi:hypothetical protein
MAVARQGLAVLEKFIAGEGERSPAYGGRSVFGWEGPSGRR